MHILITGSAGFIGFHLSRKLASLGHNIYGIDSINNYYDISLKRDRLAVCGIQNPEPNKEIHSSILENYIFRQMSLCDKKELEDLFEENHFDCVVNLAAQAGVRYSLTNPDAYIESNITGFMNLLECCRTKACNRLIYASSSSVYGNNPHVPFKESEQVDHPVSIYAATKKSNELMAYTYSHLYKIQTTGLRFFTVYGPYGRPDMAPILFANAIRKDKTIKIFNNGELARDFTYIDDIVDGIIRIVTHPEKAREDVVGVLASIYNIGHGSPMKLMNFIHILEKELGKTANKEFVGMQPGDVYQTWADTTKLSKDYGYTPYTSLEEGIKYFVEWFKQYNPTTE